MFARRCVPHVPVALARLFRTYEHALEWKHSTIETMNFGNFFEQRWGGKRGLLHHLGWNLINMSGSLRRYKCVDWERVGRLIFVCKGNICRSPYAEARAHALGLAAASFGLDADTGVPADPAAVLAAHARGIDLRSARARRNGDLLIGARDLLVGMEPTHVRFLEGFSPEHGCQVTLLGLWSNPVRPYIADPFGRSQVFFTRCFLAIDSGIFNLQTHLTSGSPCP